MNKTASLSTIAIIIGLSACTLDNPGMPSWENQLTIALEEERFTMREDLVNDSTIILKDAPDGNGQWVWINVSDTTSEADKKRIDPDDLSTVQDPKSYSDQVGTIALDNINPISTPGNNLNDLLGTSFNPGDELPANPSGGDYTLTDQVVQFISFDEMGIATADLVLTINNGLFLEISSMSIDIYNDIPGPPNLVTNVVIPGPIAGGSQKTNISLLADQILHNDLLVDYTVTLAGWDNPRTLSSADLNSTISIITDLENTKANYALLAEVPAQTFENNDSSKVGEQDDKIIFAEIDKGMLNIDFYNHLPLGGTATINFKNVFNNGQPLTLQTYIEEKNTEPVKISQDLSGLTIEEDGATPIEYFKYSVSMVTDSSEGTVEIYATDSLTAQIYLDTLFFSYIEGDIARTDLDIEPVDKNDIADYGDLASGIHLPNTELRLFFYSELGIDINTDLVITGKHKDKDTGIYTDSVTLNLNNIIIEKSLDGIEANMTTLLLSGDDPSPNIVDMMDILPTDISIRGTAYVEGLGFVALNQATWIDYELDTPLSVLVPSPVTIEGDKNEISSEDVSEDTQKFLQDDVKDALFTFTITNHLPIGVSGKVYLSNDSTNLYSETTNDSTKFIISDIFIAAAPTNSSGLVTAPIDRTVNVELTRPMLDLIASAYESPIYSGFKTTIDSTVSEVIVHADDFILNRGKFTIRFLIDSE